MTGRTTTLNNLRTPEDLSRAFIEAQDLAAELRYPREARERLDQAILQARARGCLCRSEFLQMVDAVPELYRTLREYVKDLGP